MEEIEQKLEELKKELAEVKDKIFRLNLVDHWDLEDSRYSSQLGNRLGELTRKIEELEGKLNEDI